MARAVVDAACLAVMLCCGLAAAQDYPQRALRIVTSAPGSGTDVVARILTERMPETFGQHAVVDNRGVLAPEIVAKAPKDGYTVLFYSTVLWVQPLLSAKPLWDGLRDFAPVTLMVNAPNILVVHASLPVKNVRELVALAKKRPGELNYGSGSVGSTSYLAAELFTSMAGVNIVRVPYRGVGPALLGLMGGHVQVMFPSAGSGMSHVKSGKLRALAVTSAKRSTLLPELPTIAATGVPGYEADTPLGVFFPAGTPPAIVAKLHQGLAGALAVPELRARVVDQGTEVVMSQPAEFAAWLKADVARWSGLIRDRGLREGA